MEFNIGGDLMTVCHVFINHPCHSLIQHIHHDYADYVSRSSLITAIVINIISLTYDLFVMLVPEKPFLLTSITSLLKSLNTEIMEALLKFEAG